MWMIPQWAQALIDAKPAPGRDHGLDVLLDRSTLTTRMPTALYSRARPPSNTPLWPYPTLLRADDGAPGLHHGRPDNIALAVDIHEQTPAPKAPARLAEAVRRHRDFVIRRPDLITGTTRSTVRAAQCGVGPSEDFVGWHRSAVEALGCPIPRDR